MSKLDSPELKAKKESMAQKFGIIKTMGDKKVCQACAEAARTGKPIMYPVYPNCRCHSKSGISATVQMS